MNRQLNLEFLRMPKTIVDLFDSMTKSQIKILMISLSFVFCTGGASYASLYEKIESIARQSDSERRLLQRELNKAQQTSVEHGVILESHLRILENIQTDVREIRNQTRD